MAYTTQNSTRTFFLGIPYAQPPVGDLRFRNPVSLNSSWQATANATEFSPTCHQFPPADTPASEDCLTLNVVRPSGMENVQLPVGVWIHGGAHITGSNRDAQYNMSFIVEQSVAADKPFIGVNINYRLQLYGFMYGSDFVEAGLGNLGYKYQHLALRWLQENGDHLGRERGRRKRRRAFDLLRQAWPGPLPGGHHGERKPDQPLPLQHPGRVGRILQRHHRGRQLQQRRRHSGLPARCPVRRAHGHLRKRHDRRNPLMGNGNRRRLHPEQRARGPAGRRLHQGPHLHGQNHDEGTALATRGIDTDAQFLTDARGRGADNATALRLAALYLDDPAAGVPVTLDGRAPAELGLQYKRAAAMVGDLVWHATRRLTAEIWARNGVPGWAYLFKCAPRRRI